MNHLNISINNGVAHVLFHNPPLNLLSNAIKQEIKEQFESLAEDKNVRVILFKTSGKHFCCGADLKEFPERIQKKEARKAWIEGHDMLNSIIEVPQPTVVCVQGNALGGGAELATAFDIRIFSDDAVFGYPEVFRSLYPGNGGFERFLKLVGKSNAPYVFLTGESYNASDALRLGIANKVVTKENLEMEGSNITNVITSHSNVTIQTIKKAIKNYRNFEDFYEEGMNYFAALHETEDIVESVNAFFEKRKPVYQHK